MIWILAALYILIILLEVPSLLKNRMYPELGAFTALFAVALYMGLAFYYEWPLTGLFKALMSYMQTG